MNICVYILIIIVGSQQQHFEHTVVTPPTIMGSVAPYGGFADMTQFITETYLDEWLDIFCKYTAIVHFRQFPSSSFPFFTNVINTF
jgi:hypothetical protein